jgi:hypothetical protein
VLLHNLMSATLSGEKARHLAIAVRPQYLTPHDLLYQDDSDHGSRRPGNQLRNVRRATGGGEFSPTPEVWNGSESDLSNNNVEGNGSATERTTPNKYVGHIDQSEYSDLNGKYSTGCSFEVPSLCTFCLSRSKTFPSSDDDDSMEEEEDELGRRRSDRSWYRLSASASTILSAHMRMSL